MTGRKKLKLGVPEDVTDIGVFLREVRLREKVELRDVAAKLKIRLIYLQAIEEGRFADLPGPTYVIGFIRGYAEFLKLDQQAVLAKFRSQLEGLGDKVELKFPVPEPETRVPNGAILLVSLLLVAVAYGSWYRFSMEGREDVEIVTDVPARLMGFLGDEAPPPREPLLDQGEEFVAEEAHDERFSTGGGETGESTDEVMEEDSPLRMAPQETVSAEAPSMAVMTERAGIVYFDEFGRAYVAKDGDSPLAPAFADHVPAEDISADASDLRYMERGGLGMDVGDTSASAEIENGEEVALSPHRKPAVFGDEFGDVRIVIHVTEDSWIQVRDASGDMLVSQLLHPGDSYRVPVREGLTLTTGNAGALQFLIDGNLAPSIGPPGSVRRKVVLDPDSLLSGMASVP